MTTAPSPLSAPGMTGPAVRSFLGGAEPAALSACAGRSAAPAVRPHTAIVLSAGLGKRMRPITARVPKPLVEVGGRALIRYFLHRPAGAGLSRVGGNVALLAGFPEAHLAPPTPPEILISGERDPLAATRAG